MNEQICAAEQDLKLLKIDSRIFQIKLKQKLARAIANTRIKLADGGVYHPI